MRNATEAYIAERDMRDMTGDLYQPPVCAVVRLPDPEEFADGSLEQLMAIRLREMEAGESRERGRMLAESLALATEAAHAWLEDVGYPREPKVVDWDDETDWKEGRW